MPFISRIYQPEYVFCGKDKYLKGKLTHEQLIKVRQLKVNERFRQFTVEKQDPSNRSGY